MKTKKWTEIKKRNFSNKKLKTLEARVKLELFDMDLRALRELLDITQEKLASVANMTQSEVSRLERRTDYKLSTLRKIVQALGGDLELIANFGDKRIRLHSA